MWALTMAAMVLIAFLKKRKKKLTARALDIYDYLYVVRCSRAQLGAHAHVCFFHSTLISTKCYQDSDATSTRSAFLTEYSYNRYQWLIQQQWKHAKHSAWKSKVGNCAEGRTLTKAHENTGKGYECPYKLSKVCSHPIHTHTRAHPHARTLTLQALKIQFPGTTTTRKKVSSCG